MVQDTRRSKMSNTELDQLEITRQDAEEAIELRDALVQLKKNKHYKRIFEKELFQDFAAQCVLMKGSPAAQNENTQKHIDRDIAMLGALHSRLNSIIQLGNTAEYTLAGVKDEVERLMTEE